jgi:hypothetical protein
LIRITPCGAPIQIPNLPTREAVQLGLRIALSYALDPRSLPRENALIRVNWPKTTTRGLVVDFATKALLSIVPQYDATQICRGELFETIEQELRYRLEELLRPLEIMPLIVTILEVIVPPELQKTFTEVITNRASKTSTSHVAEHFELDEVARRGLYGHLSELLDDKHKLRIFLCHAHEDKPRVHELYQSLEVAGYHPWLDEKDLLPGQDWRREIRKIIENPYNIIVVCLSSNSTSKRGVVQWEIKRALDTLDQMPEDTIYIIPAFLEPCQPPDRLSGLQWVKLYEPDGFDKLKQALDFEIAKRQPTPSIVQTRADFSSPF